MIWVTLILLFILSANGIVVPTIAWVFAWVGLGLTIVAGILKGIEKSQKNSKNY